MVDQLQILILYSDCVSGKDYNLCYPKSATGSGLDISLLSEILFQVLKRRVYLRKSAIVFIQEEAYLIEEVWQSCLNSNGYFLYSFTHVTITEETEEYLEDDTGSSVADENSIAKRLFSEEDEAVLSP